MVEIECIIWFLFGSFSVSCLMFQESLSEYQLPWRNFLVPIETLIVQTVLGGKPCWFLEDPNIKTETKRKTKSASQVCKRQWHRWHGRQVARDGWRPQVHTRFTTQSKLFCWTPLASPTYQWNVDYLLHPWCEWRKYWPGSSIKMSPRIRRSQQRKTKSSGLPSC